MANTVQEQIAEKAAQLLENMPRRGRIIVPRDEELEKAERRPAPKSFARAFQQLLDKSGGDIVRLAFEQDPTSIAAYAGVYKPKLRLIPDAVLKRTLIQDDLVAAIVQARSNHLSAFARPRPNRHANGFILDPKVGVVDSLSDEEDRRLHDRIEVAIKRLWLCGAREEDVDLLPETPHKRMTLAQCFTELCRNAVGLGRVAIERIYTGQGEERDFRMFRPVDVGTIYYSVPQNGQAKALREQAVKMLQHAQGTHGKPAIDIDRFSKDDYAYIQVVDGQAVQAFTAEELVVHNFYPVPDIELNGYPVTPLDTVIQAVTTHLHITAHNRMFFQSGRAARGILVLKSLDADEHVVARLRQQFNAVINGSHNAWRMPVFGIEPKDELNWVPIDQGGARDAEFQYLADMNARVILSAFQMSPEELPGWSYLSRGTNNQALSESNNEYKLQAARDLGIRPLISQFEDIVNTYLLPLIDPGLEKFVTFRMMGLDAETAEKELVHLQEGMNVYMVYDDVLTKVEKDPIGKEWGGQLPLNPAIQAWLLKMFSVGELKEHFCGIKGASQDPNLAYHDDPSWFQWQQLLMERQQMAMQAQMGPQGPGGQGGPGGGDEESSSGGGSPDEQSGPPEAQEEPDPTSDQPKAQTENQRSQQIEAAARAQTNALHHSVGDAASALGKSEAQLTAAHRRLLHQHGRLVSEVMRGWESDVARVQDEILAGVDDLLPPKPRKRR